MEGTSTPRVFLCRPDDLLESVCKILKLSTVGTALLKMLKRRHARCVLWSSTTVLSGLRSMCFLPHQWTKPILFVIFFIWILKELPIHFKWVWLVSRASWIQLRKFHIIFHAAAFQMSAISDSCTLFYSVTPMFHYTYLHYLPFCYCVLECFSLAGLFCKLFVFQKSKLLVKIRQGKKDKARIYHSWLNNGMLKATWWLKQWEQVP